MGIASEMKELTRNIASSHEDRMRRLAEIREEVDEARGEARGLITGFEALRRETNRQARRDLARDKAQRKSETRGILKEAQDILKSFETSRKEANARLREDLSQGTTVVRSEAREILGQASRLIKGFSKSRQNVSARLRKDLAQSKADVESGVKQMISDFGHARGDVRADLKEARAVWQGLSSTRQARKARVEIPHRTETPVVEKEIRDLDAEMLAVVSEHPEGINLVRVAEGLGVAPIVLGRASKSLIDKGKIRRDEKLYFSVAIG